MGLFRRWAMWLVAAIALPAHAADPEYYGGVMLGVASYEESGVGFNMTSFTGRLGYQMSRSFALEGRVASGGSGEGSGSTVGTTYQVEGLASLLAKLSWQPSQGSETYLHALVGATAAQTTTTVTAGSKTTNNLYGISFGFGLDLFADSTRALNIEWIQYLRGDVSGSAGNKYKLTNVGIGFLQRF